jgi:hypothetical protein
MKWKITCTEIHRYLFPYRGYLINANAIATMSAVSIGLSSTYVPVPEAGKLVQAVFGQADGALSRHSIRSL